MGNNIFSVFLGGRIICPRSPLNVAFQHTTLSDGSKVLISRLILYTIHLNWFIFCFCLRLVISNFSYIVQHEESYLHLLIVYDIRTLFAQSDLFSLPCPSGYQSLITEKNILYTPIYLMYFSFPAFWRTHWT